MAWITHLQWPAMLVTVLSSWWIGSTHPNRRRAGFYLFLLSNLLWIIWGWHDSAYALIVMQLALAATNIHGAVKARREAAGR